MKFIRRTWKDMSWEEQLKNPIRTIDDARKLGAKISKEEQRTLEEVAREFPIKITPYYADLIHWEDPKDPLRRLVFPCPEEVEKIGTTDDGYGDEPNTVTEIPGLEHKYDPTVLVLSTNACAGFCRECFRRTLVREEKQKDFRSVLNPGQYPSVKRYICDHKEISDVLISGGEPLMLPTNKLMDLIDNVLAVNVKTLRIGTRMFSYLPQRISQDSRLLELLNYGNLRRRSIRFVHHLQHPREITDEMKEAIKKTQEKGIGHYSQTVLLKGVNDNPKVLRQLFQEMDAIGIVPYYVFELMKQKGTTHLGVPTAEGFRIFQEAQEGLEGTAQTAKYVIPCETGKLQILRVNSTAERTSADARYLKTRRNYEGQKELTISLSQ